jgi:ABC-2 type transport system ATP-binding protein
MEESIFRLSKLVSAFELTEYFDTPIATLSMGTKRKVSVIAALLHEPPPLILDEPLIGLDAPLIKNFERTYSSPCK